MIIPFSTYYHFTTVAPAKGGSYTEGIVGTPIHINPLLDQANDPDKDLTAIIYGALMKYDENGNLTYDLAQSYSISDDQLNYTFVLRDNIYWHDGQPITAQDVVFSVLTAQNSEYGSYQRQNWQGVQVQAKNDQTIVFTLKNKYGQFLNTMTMGILPKHIWQNVTPMNFALTDVNLKPIGSGPYKIDKIIKDNQGITKTYVLVPFDNYYQGKPNIAKLAFSFFNSEDLMIKAYNAGRIDGLAFISSDKINELNLKGKLHIYQLKLPRYFGLFMNPSKAPLSDQNVRLALNYATDTDAIINKVLHKEAISIQSPLLPGILDIKKPKEPYSFNPGTADSLLEQAGWIKNGTIRQQTTKGTSTPLSFEITTSNWPQLVQVAQELKAQWQQRGVTISIRSLSLPELQQAIKTRDYQALLFGEVLTTDPDPFSFWHSSQKRDPGLNLALYDNPKADKILEDARQITNQRDRLAKYAELQDIIIKDAPAIFLYSPYYLYPQGNQIMNNHTTTITAPQNRFSSIDTWYVHTTRVFR